MVMTRVMTTHRNPIEIAVECGSASLLGLAAGFFAHAAMPGSSGIADAFVALGAALLVGGTGYAVVRSVGSTDWGGMRIDLSPIDGLVTAPAPLDDDELLLTDRIDEPVEQSRVVRLFAPETLQVPGELAERIDEWLEGAKSRLGERGDEPRRGHGPAASPASAALHSALADIRRSLG